MNVACFFRPNRVRILAYGWCSIAYFVTIMVHWNSLTSSSHRYVLTIEIQIHIITVAMFWGTGIRAQACTNGLHSLNLAMEEGFDRWQLVQTSIYKHMATQQQSIGAVCAARSCLTL
jgi:hypothetical protein